MINVQNVTVIYGERALFDGVSFSIQERDRVGLVGKNGAGKSTMMKIIAREENPHGGDVTKPSSATVGYLHQDMALPKGKTVMDETLTAFEEVRALEARIAEITTELETRTDYESDAYTELLHEFSDTNERFDYLGGHTMRADVEKILAGLGFKPTDMDRLTDEFSGGWQMRIELAKMLLRKPDFLLLDEPTNHLDIESILWLEEFLKFYSGAVVLISHDKTFLDNITKRTIEIELGNVYDYKANYSKYLEQRSERREQQLNAFNNQQTQLAQMQRNIDRFRAKANKASFAQSLIKQMDKIDRIELDDVDSSEMKLRFPPAPRSGEVTVEGDKVVKHYDKLQVLNGVDLVLDRGERIAFVGQNGQGKTTLAKILCGIENATAGAVKLGHNVHLGYYAQNQAEKLPMNKTLLEIMEMNCPWEMRTQLRNILGSFMFGGSDVDKKASVLSGGERARLAMAVLLLNPINLLVLDEPTNHLDIRSKEVLKRSLMKYDGTLIVVSHDRDFLGGLTDRTIEFRDGQIYNHLGDVNAFLEKRKLEDMRTLSKRSSDNSKAKAAPSVNEQNEIAKKVELAERKINLLEMDIKDLENKMSVTGFYESKHAEQIMQKYANKKNEHAAMMKEWEMAIEML